jgi:protein O-GlcNAc transferase
VPDYVAAATAIATAPQALAEIRAGLRRRLSASPIRAEDGYVRALEAAYDRWWGAYTKSR